MELSKSAAATHTAKSNRRLIYLAQRQDFTKKAKLKFFTKAFVVLAGSLVKLAKKLPPNFFI